MANTEKFIFSSESVTEGHPDKVADQISNYQIGRASCRERV